MRWAPLSRCTTRSRRVPLRPRPLLAARDVAPGPPSFPFPRREPQLAEARACAQLRPAAAHYILLAALSEVVFTESGGSDGVPAGPGLWGCASQWHCWRAPRAQVFVVLVGVFLTLGNMFVVLDFPFSSCGYTPAPAWHAILQPALEHHGAQADRAVSVVGLHRSNRT